MKPPKFKIGDKVRVLRASTSKEHNLWGDEWVSWMDVNIGKVLIVNNLKNHGNHYKYYKYSLDGCWYPEFVLERGIRIGQQLLFTFMEQQ